MREIALYYPYIHVRDDTWLKAAALYWPKIARMTPVGYPQHDSPVARRLADELDFFVNIDPRGYTEGISWTFAHFIEKNRKSLQAKYPAPYVAESKRPYTANEALQIRAAEAVLRSTLSIPQSRYEAMPPMHTAEADGSLVGWIHHTKATGYLCHLLQSSRLGLARGEWIAVAPELAAVYVTALAEEVASANDLAVVTDQPETYGVLNGWDFNTFAHILLGGDDSEPEVDAEQVAAMYAAVAIQAVVPAGLSEIPVEKIIKVRRKLSAEFDSFRDHLNSLTDKFTEISYIQDASVLQARLQLLVERDLRQPADQLERSLRQLGLEPAQAVLGMNSLELPAISAGAASALALPPVVGQAGLIATRLITSSFRARTRRRSMMQSSPAGYLLGLKKQLTPGGILERLNRMMLRGQSINKARPPASS